MSLETLANGRNSVSVHMYDGIYPLTEEMSFPEALISIETISQLHKRRNLLNKLPRFLRNMFGLGADDHYGERSGEGHYVVEIRPSQRFIAKYGIERFGLEPQMFLRPGDPSVILSAWCGDINIASLLTKGMIGFADPIKIGDGFAGRLQAAKDIVKIGEADYEAGWFMNDDQMFRMLDAIMRYPGITEGYTFLSRTGDELSQGWNCGAFFWYLMDKSGLVPKEESERLKIDLRYADIFFDNPLPLSPAGEKGVRWLKNKGEALIPEWKIAALVGVDMFVGKCGVEFFDKRKIVEEIVGNRPKYHAARIWEHANVIEWLRNPANRDFESQGIITELLPTVREGRPLGLPYRTVEENEHNRYVLSSHYARLQEKGDEYRRRKLLKAGLHDRHLEFRALEAELYKKQ